MVHKTYAGAGYEAGKTLIVDVIGQYFYFFKDHSGGIREFALKSIDEVRDEKLKELGI